MGRYASRTTFLSACVGMLSFSVILGVTGCSRIIGGRDAIATGELRIQIQSEPISFDPALAEDGIGFRIVTSLYRGLFRVDAEGRVIGDLADLRSVSADGRVYELELRDDAIWSDGTRITPDHVRFGIERALESKRIAKFARFLERIEGVADWRAGRARHISGIEIGEAIAVTGAGAAGESSPERRIRFRLSTPYPLFTAVLSLPLAYPMRPDFFGAKGEFELTRPNLAFSTAYRLAEYVPDQRLVLESWGKSLPTGAPTRVRFQIVRDESTARSLFETGRLDILTKISPYDIGTLGLRGRLRVSPFAAVYFLGFNFRDPRVRDVALRRRVRDAIRREEIVTLLKAGEAPAYSFIPRGFEGYWEFAHARSKAAAIAGKAPPTWKGPPLELSYDGTERNQAVLEKVQADLKRAGIPVVLQPHDWKTHSAKVYSDPTVLYRYGWSTPVLDPLFFLIPFDRDSGFALGGLPAGASLHAEVERVAVTPPGPERRGMIEALQKRILDAETWVVPIYHYVSVLGVSARVQSVPQNALGAFRVEEVRLNP